MHDPDDPEGVPLEHVGRLEVDYAVDTTFLADASPAALRLRDLRDEGWIRLVRTDLFGSPSIDARVVVRGELEAAAVPYLEQRGRMPPRHRRIDGLDVEEDDPEQRLAEVLEALFPSSRGTVDRTAEDVRAAVPVTTAIRYGMVGFLTRDPRLAQASERVQERFDEFTIGDPESVLDYVEQRLYGWRFIDGQFYVVDEADLPCSTWRRPT